MSGREDDLILYLLAMAAGTALGGGVIAWIMARRHGWRAALLVPLAILFGAVGMVWRSGGLDRAHFGQVAVLAAPAVIGALTGLAIGALRR